MTLAEIVALPKVQLHCHLEGTLHRERFRELAVRHGVNIGGRATVPLESTYAFSDFGEFLLLFRDVARAARPADFARWPPTMPLTRPRKTSDMRKCSCRRRFGHGSTAIDVKETVAATRAALERKAETGSSGSICDLTRNFGAARAFETAERRLPCGPGVVGIGLGGDEANYPAALYRATRSLRARWGCTAWHTPARPPVRSSVREALDVLGAERIGHGVRALADPALVAELAERRVALELCPTSNHLTGAVAVGEAHPIAAFDAAGVLLHDRRRRSGAVFDDPLR